MIQMTINQQLSAIWQLIANNFAYGASIEEISAAMPFQLERRTLQRRLDLLKEQGVIQANGKTKSTRYTATQHEYRPRPKADVPKVDIRLSGPASLALQTVSQPLEKRNRVNVNSFFLEGFRPNIDNYFNEEEKKQLNEMGRTKFTGYAAGTYAKGVMHAMVPDLSWNSSRLEGASYAQHEAEALFSRNEFAEGLSDLEHQMMLNHKDAVEFVVNTAEDIQFDKYTVLNLHALLSNNLLVDASTSGRLRRLPVVISQSTYIPAGSARQVEESFTMLLEKAGQIRDPFEQAFFMLVQLPYLQPFADVNMPVARIAANISLVKNNLMPLIFSEIPVELFEKAMLSVYELNRTDILKDLFIFAYERSCARYRLVKHKNGEPDPFRITYREQIRTVVFDIVTGNMMGDAANEVIEHQASAMPARDQLRFSELVEKELATLHEGNIARYWIRPAEFIVWKASWESGLTEQAVATTRVIHMGALSSVAIN
jgi:hypothetical protein